MEIVITVRDKIAYVQDDPEIICGNTDYAVQFDFDAEWDVYTEKTAHFAYISDGKPQFYDVIFEGDSVIIPPLYRTNEVLIGVYAGNIRTTTPAAVPCLPCITDGQPVHPDPPPDVYAQLLALLESLNTKDDATILPLALWNTIPGGTVINAEEVS